MAGGQWEVVGGKAKKPKNKGNASKGPAKDKSKENNVLDASVSGPIAESHTIYNAFLEKEKKDPPKPKGNDVSKVPEKNTSKKKKVEKKQVVSKASLEDAFAEVTEEELKNHLATLEVLCPDSPLLWLKDLASYLNVKMDLPVEDLTFSAKPLGYPSLLLNKKVYQVIVKLFNRCTPQVLQIFYDFCLQSMVQDTLKGLHTLGYRVMLQCLANEMPSVALANLTKCSDLCNAHQNRQNICLSVLWAIGQAGNNNLEAGFRVWLDVMFPLIGSKNCTAYAVDYLEKLVSGADSAKCSKSLLDVRDLFPILDLIYSKELIKSIQKRLIALYPTLKALSYGPEPENVLRNYFPSYLRRLSPHCPQPMKEEILDSLMYCLEKDSRCYSIWRQLYAKQYTESVRLISHINEHWLSVPSKFPKRCLRDTLSAFQVTNEELNLSTKSVPGVKESILVVNELLSKINAGSFSWIRLVLFLILVVSTLLTYDVWVHKSFAASISGKFMKDSGFLVICAQAGEKFQYFYDKVQKLCEQYFPVLVSWSRRTVLPFLEFVVQKVSEVAVLLWKSTFSLRVWCTDNIPPFLIGVEKYFVLCSGQIWSVAQSVAVVASKAILSVLTHLTTSADSFATWLQSRPEIMSFLESIKTHFVSVSGNIKENVVYLFQLAKNYFPLFPA